jgi:S1-C subfamily serine protease
MFAKASRTIREAIYGLNGLSQINPQQVNATNATGFAIAPGVLATAAHFCHQQNDPSKPVHQRFEAIRSPDVGQAMESAVLVAEDVARDLAILRLEKPRSRSTVKLERAVVPTGTACGSLGFPLATIVFSQAGRMFNLFERFQSGSISRLGKDQHPSGRSLEYYETDFLMYPGSSGCPGFLANARVFGMHTASVMERAQSSGTSAARTSISIWVPASDIIVFANTNGVKI